MATYQTVRCPHCKEYLKFWKKKRSHGVFGTPIIRCSNCSKLIKTGKKLWRNMDNTEKIIFHLSAYFSFSFWFALGFPILTSILGGKEIPKYVILIMALVGLGISILIHRNQMETLKSNAKLYEDDYDNETYEYQEF
ncbi:MAG: hypothetical protein R2797_13205 [Gelidibacter sp.]